LIAAAYSDDLNIDGAVVQRLVQETNEDCPVSNRYRQKLDLEIAATEMNRV